MWLFLAFLAVPMIEIALFIQVGGIIGLWPTLAIVLLTAIAGSWLVRTQGLQELRRLQGSLSSLSDPTEPLAGGAMILLAGAFLLTPGFFTDAVGLALLVPGVRRAVYRELRRRVVVVRGPSAGFPRQEGGASGQTRPHPQDSVIDGDFTELPPDRRATHRPSGWTRH